MTDTVRNYRSPLLESDTQVDIHALPGKTVQDVPEPSWQKQATLTDIEERKMSNEDAFHNEHDFECVQSSFKNLMMSADAEALSGSSSSLNASDNGTLRKSLRKLTLELNLPIDMDDGELETQSELIKSFGGVNVKTGPIHCKRVVREEQGFILQEEDCHCDACESIAKSNSTLNGATKFAVFAEGSHNRKESGIKKIFNQLRNWTSK